MKAKSDDKSKQKTKQDESTEKPSGQTGQNESGNCYWWLFTTHWECLNSCHNTIVLSVNYFIAAKKGIWTLWSYFALVALDGSTSLVSDINWANSYLSWWTTCLCARTVLRLVWKASRRIRHVSALKHEPYHQFLHNIRYKSWNITLYDVWISRNTFVRVFSISANVCDSNRESATDVSKGGWTKSPFSQGQRHNTVHRVSLGKYDHDASQSHSIMACYGI